MDAVAWLRQELNDLGFWVAVVDGEDVEADLARTLEELSPEDEVFFHLSGRLTERGVVRTAAGRCIRLEALGDALAARAGERTAFFAELLHDDDPADNLLAGEHLSWLVEAIAPRARRYAMLAAVRPRAAAVDGLALTRLFLAAARESGPGPILSTAVYHRVLANPASARSAQSFTFVRSGEERDASPTSAPQAPLASFEAVPLSSFPAARPAGVDSEAPPPAAARAAEVDGRAQSLSDRIDEAAGGGQWRRVIALRRERLQQVEHPRLRVRELVAIARILQAELDDAEGAIATLEEARAVDPTRVSVLQALERGYERLGRWDQAFEVLGALVELAPSPTDRAELRYGQARLALDRLDDTELAFALLQSALADDPAHERAIATFDEVCAVRART
ncbi:MAG: hypothetical protein JOZ69_22340, partial [Myxococcales bacterium]|nr:hypothetical protein [Myxococcales bacterium]